MPNQVQQDCFGAGSETKTEFAQLLKRPFMIGRNSTHERRRKEEPRRHECACGNLIAEVLQVVFFSRDGLLDLMEVAQAARIQSKMAEFVQQSEEASPRRVAAVERDHGKGCLLYTSDAADDLLC